MNEAEALTSLRQRFPDWVVWVDRGVWHASGDRLIWASSPEVLEAALECEAPFPPELVARRVRVRAHRGVKRP